MARLRRGILRVIPICRESSSFLRTARAPRILAVLATIDLSQGFAPSSPADGTTQITGAVSSAVTKAPIEGVEVCEYPDEGGAGAKCTQTGSSGEYVLEVSRGGEFVVSFDTTTGGSYPTLFTTGPSPTTKRHHEATRVQVAEGQTVSGIDEAIKEGGRITGRVQTKPTTKPVLAS